MYIIFFSKSIIEKAIEEGTFISEINDEAKKIYSELFENNPKSFKDILKDNYELVEYLIDKSLFATNDKKRIFEYFQKLAKHLSPLELDVSLDLLAKKINTSKDILKREINFQSKTQIDIDKPSMHSKNTNAHMVI